METIAEEKVGITAETKRKNGYAHAKGLSMRELTILVNKRVPALGIKYSTIATYLRPKNSCSIQSKQHYPRATLKL